MTIFQRAQRTQKKLRIAIDGPSGSGKTYSALLIAKGLASGELERVALVDTEHASASLYSDLGPFSVAEMNPPYSVEKYVKALEAAAAEGFEVVILDSLTHAWSGEGGILDVVDRIAKTRTNGNSFAAWREGSPLQKKLTDALLSCPMHVIATMRTKTEYVIEENERGKKAPRKVGLAPEQRKDFEYDMDLVLDVTREHFATASKDRTGVWAERMETPTEAHGVELLAWLGAAAPAPVRAAPAVETGPEPAPQSQAEPAAPHGNGHITKTQAQRLHEMLFAIGHDSADFLARIGGRGIGDGEHLTSIPADQYDYILEVVGRMEDKAAAALAAVREKPAEEPDPELSPESQQFLDETAGNGHRAEPEPAKKKGTITAPQLTRLGALCADLEAQGVTEGEWRFRMAEAEKVASRTELTKAAAMRLIDRFQGWVNDLRAGFIAPGEKVA